MSPAPFPYPSLGQMLNGVSWTPPLEVELRWHYFQNEKNPLQLLTPLLSDELF